MIINNKTITAVRLEEWNDEACVKISDIQCHLSTDSNIIVVDTTMDYNGSTLNSANDIIAYVNQNM